MAAWQLSGLGSPNNPEGRTTVTCTPSFWVQHSRDHSETFPLQTLLFSLYNIYRDYCIYRVLIIYAQIFQTVYLDTTTYFKLLTGAQSLKVTCVNAFARDHTQKAVTQLLLVDNIFHFDVSFKLTCVTYSLGKWGKGQLGIFHWCCTYALPPMHDSSC